MYMLTYAYYIFFMLFIFIYWTDYFFLDLEIFHEIYVQKKSIFSHKDISYFSSYIKKPFHTSLEKVNADGADVLSEVLGYTSLQAFMHGLSLAGKLDSFLHEQHHKICSENFAAPYQAGLNNNYERFKSELWAKGRNVFKTTIK